MRYDERQYEAYEVGYAINTRKLRSINMQIAEKNRSAALTMESHRDNSVSEHRSARDHRYDLAPPQGLQLTTRSISSILVQFGDYGQSKHLFTILAD